MTIPNRPKLASESVVPSQPAAQYYGIQELALFKNFNRESYRAAFGVEPPPYDLSRLTKTWFDSTAVASNPEDVSVYKIVVRDKSGTWGVRQMVISSLEAATVNLPGEVVYLRYLVAPTEATRGDAPINPNYLSFEADAKALSAEVGGSGVMEEVLGMFPAVYPATELRRVWNILFRNRVVNAGLLLLQRNAKGLGNPGQWNLSGEEPVWVPAAPGPTGLEDTRPLRETPVRDLLPNEVLQTGLMGVGVSRTDLREPTGEFTEADRSMLQAIYNAVKK